MKLSEIKKNVEKYIDQEITVEGWIRQARFTKNVGFIELNDGTIFKNLQIVIGKELENFEDLQKEHLSASLKVKGILVKTNNAKQAFELQAKSVEVLGHSDEKFPIQKQRQSLSPFQKVAYIFIAISGLAIGHYILRLTLESVDKFGDSSFSARLSLVDLFFIILFLVLMLYIYQLGYSKEENIRLLEEQKIYELERTEFNSLSETTERLRKMKHDMQIYVDAINVLAKDKKWDELIAYTEQYHNTLATTQSAIATGNIAIDCILTAKLDYAEKHGIKTEYSIMAPENFPLDSVELSSILGNIWNNSIEAGERLIISDPTEHPYIYFYIKPYQNMILIHIENNYDGVIKGSIDGDILSVKQGKEHGLGIRRVKELVEKADGVLQITSDNKIFSVHIMIPDKENNKLL